MTEINLAGVSENGRPAIRPAEIARERFGSYIRLYGFSVAGYDDGTACDAPLIARKP